MVKHRPQRRSARHRFRHLTEIFRADQSKARVLMEILECVIDMVPFPCRIALSHNPLNVLAYCHDGPPISRRYREERSTITFGASPRADGLSAATVRISST